MGCTISSVDGSSAGVCSQWTFYRKHHQKVPRFFEGVEKPFTEMSLITYVHKMLLRAYVQKMSLNDRRDT